MFDVHAVNVVVPQRRPCAAVFEYLHYPIVNDVSRCAVVVNMLARQIFSACLIDFARRVHEYTRAMKNRNAITTIASIAWFISISLILRGYPARVLPFSRRPTIARLANQPGLIAS